MKFRQPTTIQKVVQEVRKCQKATKYVIYNSGTHFQWCAATQVSCSSYANNYSKYYLLFVDIQNQHTYMRLCIEEALHKFVLPHPMPPFQDVVVSQLQCSLVFPFYLIMEKGSIFEFFILFYLLQSIDKFLNLLKPFFSSICLFLSNAIQYQFL